MTPFDPSQLRGFIACKLELCRATTQDAHRMIRSVPCTFSCVMPCHTMPYHAMPYHAHFLITTSPVSITSTHPPTNHLTAIYSNPSSNNSFFTITINMIRTTPEPRLLNRIHIPPCRLIRTRTTILPRTRDRAWTRGFPHLTR
jgi:hypothetical protein